MIEAVHKEVAAHSACWAQAGPPIREGKRAATNQERWHQIHDLLNNGVGLLECAGRLDLALNAVKRYTRVPEPERLIRTPVYRPTVVDPYRDHLRKRRAEDPAVPVLQLLAETKPWAIPSDRTCSTATSPKGASNENAPTSPCAGSPARLLVIDPRNPTEKDRVLAGTLAATCPEMTAVAQLTGTFAQLPRPAPQNSGLLDEWTTAVRSTDLPHLQAFTRGLDYDKDAVRAALTLPFHNGGAEGVNTKTKRIMRQMHGRAGFSLLRHRILLG
jgi:hypothetical protein